MRKLFIALILTLLLFSGCSQMGGSKIGKDKEQDITGYGLELDFNINTKYIDQKKLLYDLKIRNTGLKNLILSRENFYLKTVQRDEGRYYFNSESLNNFYAKIFDNSQQITLHNDQEIVIEGVLKIADSFYDVATNERLEYELEATYDYETVFNNNLELVEEYDIFSLKKLDRVSQAAPLQISDIQLIPDERDGEYILEYHFEDRGKSYFTTDKTEVKINEIEILLGSQNIISNCEGVYKEADKEKDRDPVNELKVRNDQDLVLECRVTLENKETFTTKTSGNFKYNYKVKLKGEFSVPRD